MDSYRSESPGVRSISEPYTGTDAKFEGARSEGQESGGVGHLPPWDQLPLHLAQTRGTRPPCPAPCNIIILEQPDTDLTITDGLQQLVGHPQVHHHDLAHTELDLPALHHLQTIDTEAGD